MKKFILMMLLVAPAVASAETQPECISRVKQSMAACGEVCERVMSTKKDVEVCYKICGAEAREQFIDECHVPLKR